MQIQNTLRRLKKASSGAFSHPAALVGFVAVAFFAPFLMVTTGNKEPNRLPGAFWVILLLMVVPGIIGAGFLRFTHESREAEAISIRPGRKSAAVRETRL